MESHGKPKEGTKNIEPVNWKWLLQNFKWLWLRLWLKFSRILNRASHCIVRRRRRSRLQIRAFWLCEGLCAWCKTCFKRASQRKSLRTQSCRPFIYCFLQKEVTQSTRKESVSKKRRQHMIRKRHSWKEICELACRCCHPQRHLG